MKKNILLIIILYLMAVTSLQAEWSSAGDISRVRTWGGSTVFASLSSLISDNSLTSCGNTNNVGQFSFSLEPAFPQSLLFSMLLSAEMNNRKIKVYLTGNCLGKRSEIRDIEIVD